MCIVEEKTAYREFGIICGFRHPLGDLALSPADKTGATVLCTIKIKTSLGQVKTG